MISGNTDYPSSVVMAPDMQAIKAMQGVAVNENSMSNENSVATGYPTQFTMKLEGAIDRMENTEMSGAFLLVNIDNLAMIVSGYGHDASEHIMGELEGLIADAASAVTCDVDRIQRDQFGVIITGCTELEANGVAAAVMAAVQAHSFDADTYGSLHIMCHAAAIIIPTRAKTAKEAIDLAYIGLHDTSGQVLSSPEYAESLSANARQQMGLANYLHEAIRDDRLAMAYQPIIDSRTGKVAHYEALLRLHGKDGRISSAGALVPIAEKMGMIDVIDHKVLHMVVNELRSSRDVHMALNVSNITTRDDVWLNEFRALMKETPEIAERIIVEITETAVQHDMRRSAYFVGSVQALGAKVALDDFGSGYTSFRQLKQLSVDMVKIDGAFIKDLVDNADNRFFVKTLLDFTNAFGLTSVAEFVENGEIAKMLMELGVHYLQGYYFGRPENHRSWLSDGEYSA